MRYDAIMIAVLSNFWAGITISVPTTAPKPPRRTEPVFIGDILLARGGEPELLRKWREEAERDGDGDG